MENPLYQQILKQHNTRCNSRMCASCPFKNNVTIGACNENLDYYDIATNRILTDSFFQQWNYNIKTELIGICNQPLPAFLNIQIDNTMNKVKQQSYNQQYWNNFINVDIHIQNNLPEKQIIKIKDTSYRETSTELTKLIYDIIKQIVSQYIDKSNLSEQEKKELELCQDILDAYDIGQTMRNQSKPMMDRLKAFVEAVKLLDKYFPYLVA